MSLLYTETCCRDAFYGRCLGFQVLGISCLHFSYFNVLLVLSRTQAHPPVPRHCYGFLRGLVQGDEGRSREATPQQLSEGNRLSRDRHVIST